MANIPLSPDVALASALPQLIAAERRLRALAAREGIVGWMIAPFGGFRTESDTTTILGYRQAEYAQYVKRQQAAGKPAVDVNTFRRIAPFGKSYHDYGGAFDAAFIDYDTGHLLPGVVLPKGMTADQALSHLGALAPSAGLQWGASFNDRPHFQLPVTLDKVKALWQTRNNPAQAIAAPVAEAVNVTGDALASIGQLAVPGVQAVGTAAQAARRVIIAPLRAAVGSRGLAGPAIVSVAAVVAFGMLAWLAVQHVTGGSRNG